MKFIFKELMRHRWRTLSSIIGFTIAALFIILLKAFNSHYQRDSFKILKGTGTHFIVYIPSSKSCCNNFNGKGGICAEGVYTHMLSRNMLQQLRQIDGIKDAAPYLLYKIFDDHFQSDISIGGIDTNSYATRTNVCAVTNVIEGKFISADTNEIVVEQSFAQAHQLHIGDSLHIFGSTLTLAGIINSGIKPAKADFYAPIENVQLILKNKLRCNAPGFDMNIILIEVADARRQEEVINAVKKQMLYASISSYNCYEPARNVMSIIGRATSVLNVIVLLFLIIFAAKTQTTSLMERLQEIGILKSLGWSNISIAQQMIAVSLILSICGSMLGSAIAVGVITAVYHLKINLLLILMVNGLLIIGGLIASMYPIIRIYRLKAGEIMKNYL